MFKLTSLTGFIAEIMLPVGFMAILVAIKNVTTVYDSPAVAYYCGNTFPWFYTSLFPIPDISLFTEVPVVCTQQPSTCDAHHYYQVLLSICILLIYLLITQNVLRIN